MCHRVLTLIPFLNYGQLSKILPKEKMFTSKVVPCIGGTTILPKLAKELGASNYGVLTEEVIETIINEGDLSLIDNITDVNAWKPLKEFIHNEFKDIPLQCQVPLTYGQIIGHIDLMSFDTIYDIKTSGRFGRMRINTILQLLSYYTLAKLNGLPIKQIGLVLPLQSQVVTYNLEKWNYLSFYEELVKCIDFKLAKEINCYNLTLDQQQMFLQLYNQFVGHHCHKDQLTLSDKPLQFFVSGNQTSKITFTKKFKNNLQDINKKSCSPVFIHAPYILNLSFPGKKERPDDDLIKKELKELAYGSWTFYCLKQLLKFGCDTGCQGVVLHVGKTCGEDIQLSVNNFRQSVIDCSIFATESCLLLIETPAGQKGEILTSPEELCDFYDGLPDKVKKVVGIVVDSCHVFSAGFNPVEYIKILIKRNVPINLVHYNDSKGECGCKKDRHAMIGKGYIGLQSLYDVLNYCIKNNIPMLTE